MTVLRSRVIAAVKEPPNLAGNKEVVGVLGPSTPMKNLEGLNHHRAISSPLTLSSKAPALIDVGSGSGNAGPRRSLRLASKLDSGLNEGGDGVEECVKSVSRKRKKSVGADESNLGTSVADMVVDGVNAEVEDSGGTIKVKVEHDTTVVKPDDLSNLDGGVGSGSRGNRKRKLSLKDRLSSLVFVSQDQSQEEKIRYLRSGRIIVKSEVNPSNVEGSQEVGNIGGNWLFSDNESKGTTDENGGAVSDSKENVAVADYDSTNRGKKLSGKGKDKLVGEDSFTNDSGSGTHVEQLTSEADGNSSVRAASVDTRSPRRKDKGKEKVVDKGFTVSSADAVNQKSSNDVGRRNNNRFDSSSVDATSTQNAERMNSSVNPRQRFREIAKQNAYRFAYFSAEDGEVNISNEVPHGEYPPSDPNGEAEDWPGPFSTAMKIIRDRKNLCLQQKQTSTDKRGAALVSWVPRKDRKDSFNKKSVPSLQDICVETLVKHADAITSLNCVPDVLRHKLSQLLSDSRWMNSHFLSLLLQGSPAEIRVRDCSWLSEEIFTEKFGGCDTSNLMVLQLDQCGRCLADYILVDTLACSANSLPSLTTISLRAAYRLSDIGLSAVVSSAPSLRSVDLSQCSLISSDGICCLSASLGSVLRELYLDDCEGIDAMLILPALVNLENLEVLSLSGLETVCDEFLCNFVSARGHRIKELILADCVKLTNISVKLIAETCPELCAVDLSNLCNLTDTALGYLSNGCRVLQTLKMQHNSFSDEAVAAYLETRGDSLRELSLSHVKQVSQCTAMSLSRYSNNLNYLDVSWCRNLSDEALGLIVDSCSSLKVLKVFGCTQITDVFMSGHSNEEVEIIGLKMKPFLDHLRGDNISDGPLRYSSANF